MKTFKDLFGTKAPSLPLCILVILIISTFFMGGSSRGDVDSLIILRPLCVIALGFSCFSLTNQQFVQHKILIILIVGYLMLHLIYLLPIFDFGSLVFTKSEYQNFTMGNSTSGNSSAAIDLIGAKNSFFAAALPCAVTMLAIQLNWKDHIYLLNVIIIAALIGGLLGIVQIFSSSNSFLYFYDITNVGSAVGFFANRNHQAVFLAMIFPMLVAYASLNGRSGLVVKGRYLVAVLCGAVLFPLILITGSRSGFIVSIFALISCIVIYKNVHPIAGQSQKWRIVGALVGIGALGLLTVTMSRAEAWERLIEGDSFSAGRGTFWASTVDIMDKVFPLGTGPGGFAAAFASIEPTAILDSTYLNHAHNDWLEWLANFGLPGIGFLLISGGLFCISAVQYWNASKGQLDQRVFLKLGVTIVTLIALASIGDYPIRTPILSCLFALALCWAMGGVSLNLPPDRVGNRPLEGN